MGGYRLGVFLNAVNVVVDNAGPQVVADSPSPSPLLSSIGYRPTRGRWNACASNRQHRQDRPLHVSPNAVGWSNTSSNYLDRSGNRDCHSTNTLTSRSTFVDGDRTPVRAPTGVSADTDRDRLARMSDLPPIPEGATGWDYERLNGKAYLIMALDEMVCLADSGLQRRGISEESRSAFWDELAQTSYNLATSKTRDGRPRRRCLSGAQLRQKSRK